MNKNTKGNKVKCAFCGKSYYDLGGQIIHVLDVIKRINQITKNLEITLNLQLKKMRHQSRWSLWR